MVYFNEPNSLKSLEKALVKLKQKTQETENEKTIDSTNKRLKKE